MQQLINAVSDAFRDFFFFKATGCDAINFLGMCVLIIILGYY